jgi:hypothetical protein
VVPAAREPHHLQPSETHQHARRGAPKGDVFLAESAAIGFSVLAADVTYIPDDLRTSWQRHEDTSPNVSGGKGRGRRECTKRVFERDPRATDTVVPSKSTKPLREAAVTPANALTVHSAPAVAGMSRVSTARVHLVLTPIT